MINFPTWVAGPTTCTTHTFRIVLTHDKNGNVFRHGAIIGTFGCNVADNNRIIIRHYNGPRNANR